MLTQTLIKNSRTLIISVMLMEITKENQGTCRMFSCFPLSDCFRRGTKHSSGTHISGVEKLPVQVSVVETVSLVLKPKSRSNGRQITYTANASERVFLPPFRMASIDFYDQRIAFTPRCRELNLPPNSLQRPESPGSQSKVDVTRPADDREFAYV